MTGQIGRRKGLSLSPLLRSKTAGTFATLRKERELLWKVYDHVRKLRLMSYLP
jgi:hypothetical protein